MDISVEEFVRELKAGNQNVFQQVFNDYYKLLCYEAMGYFKAGLLVEEIVCDVFTRIWFNRGKLNITSSIRDYLIKSVHNNCINYYRHQKAQEKYQSRYSDTYKDDYSLADLGESPLDYILTKELEDHINKAIDSLPEQYKKTFLLSRVHNLTYEEIAVEMRISINSVKTNIKKTLARLREQLKNFLSIALLYFIASGL